MELKELVDKCHKGAKDKGFWDFDRNVGEMLMLITSELGEALEAHRLADLCGGLGIDIERQINWKLNYNAQRERLHGKQY